MKRTNVLQTGLVIGFFGLLGLTGCSESEPSQPNIILIMSDDQGWGDMQNAGNPYVETPFLDEIAGSGVQFNHFYVNPMCAPTRAALLTGKENLRSGTSWVGRRTDFLSLEAITLADILNRNGYATGCYGKWHLGAYGPYHPNERGFDDFTGFLEGACDHYYKTDLEHNRKKFISDSYITDLLTDSAISFIDKNRDQPFFCYIPYNVPHHPFQVPERYFEKYKQKGVEDDRTAVVYGMIENMDENIGRIIGYLKKHQLEENTIIVFLSDNGPAFPRYNDGLLGKKAEVTEGGVRVPFYMQWKGGIPQGKIVNDISAHIDVMPTLLDFAGIKIPDGLSLDGISLKPWILGEDEPYPDRTIYTHQTVFGDNRLFPGGLRTDNYRLMNTGKRYQLFDMVKDPGQQKDIAKERPDVLDDLITRYETWYSDVTSQGTEWPPVPVGYMDFNDVNIIAPDALIYGNIGYSGRWGWATCWALNWTSTADSMVWEIDVYEEGNYEFVLHYWCEPENTGSTFSLKSDNGVLRKSLTEPNDSPFIELPNLAKPEEPRIRKWSQFNMGKMQLSKGEQRIVLKADYIPGRHAGEFRSLEIIRMKPSSLGIDISAEQ
jgi:arylsulfatase A-like enzyme